MRIILAMTMASTLLLLLLLLHQTHIWLSPMAKNDLALPLRSNLSLHLSTRPSILAIPLETSIAPSTCNPLEVLPKASLRAALSKWRLRPALFCLSSHMCLLMPTP